MHGVAGAQGCTSSFCLAMLLLLVQPHRRRSFERSVDARSTPGLQAPCGAAQSRGEGQEPRLADENACGEAPRRNRGLQAIPHGRWQSPMHVHMPQPCRAPMLCVTTCV